MFARIFGRGDKRSEVPKTPEKQISDDNFEFEEMELPTPPRSGSYWTPELLAKDLGWRVNPFSSPVKRKTLHHEQDGEKKVFHAIKPVVLRATIRQKPTNNTGTRGRRYFGSRPEPYSLLSAPTTRDYGFIPPKRISHLSQPEDYFIYGVKTDHRGEPKFLVNMDPRDKKVWKGERHIKGECIDAYMKNLKAVTNEFKNPVSGRRN